MKDCPAHKDITEFKVAVDFDGCMVHHPSGNTVHDYRNTPLVPVDGAIDWCQKFTNMGMKIILWTSRGTQSFLSEAQQYMFESGILVWAINNNPDQKYWSDSSKVHAHVYVDDNGLVPLVYPIEGRRGVVDWERVGPMVVERFVNKSKYYF